LRHNTTGQPQQLHPTDNTARHISSSCPGTGAVHAKISQLHLSEGRYKDNENMYFCFRPDEFTENVVIFGPILNLTRHNATFAFSESISLVEQDTRDDIYIFSLCSTIHLSS